MKHITGKAKKVKILSKKVGRNSRNFLISELPSNRKNLDNMKLLISYSEFQQAVKEARKYLDIPENGFNKDNPETIEQWTRKIDKRSDQMMESADFIRQLKMVREKLRGEEIGMHMAKKQSQLLHYKIPWNYLTNTSKFLTEKFNIPENYEYPIRQYIISNYINAPTSNFSGGEYPAWKRPKEIRYIPIKIYARLTDTDLKELKRHVDRYGKHLPKFQALKNIDKKLTIEQWFENRSKYDSAEDRDYKTTTAEIAENLFGNKKHAKKVYEVVREIKELRIRRFGKR